MLQYSIDQAHDDHFAQLIYQVENGDTVEITRLGQRVAVIIPAQEYDQKLKPKHKSTKSFGESILEFRKQFGLDNRTPEEGEMTDEEFDSFIDGLRDRSPGRDVDIF